mmetsp:Transcript_95291/g.188866  ORF Transcript_95291/g.188866 Transcript_95291/m.188866 type:complete len:411 (-) Transcript_95291:73-1305(-)
MAAVLQGGTSHAQWAPLSTGTTIAINRHLQEQIEALQAEVSDVNTKLKETVDALEDLRKSVPTPNSTAEVKLRDDVAGVRVATEDQRNDLTRTNEVVTKLQNGLGDNRDTIVKLQDMHKNANINLNKVAKDLAEQTAQQKKMQNTMERRVQADITMLGDGVSTANLDIKHLRGDVMMLIQGLRDEREEMRQNNLRAQEASDNFKAMKINVAALEKRVEDNTLGRKALREELDEVNLSIKKLFDDHEHSKKRNNDLTIMTSKIQDHVKELHKKQEATLQNLGTTQNKLHETMSDSEDLKRAVDQALNSVQHLGESHQSSNRTINDLHAQLSQLGGTTMALKQGLKEQSQLLLPNITMDHSEARAATARHGSILASPMNATMGRGGTAPAPKPRGTPRSPAGLRSAVNTEWT